ncbi:probable 39S ribosomal protein L23, mitochondrial [Uloborus diversus]|uniref:probable 39S ribosomal protein L23, mitochondrial n=1 Tax=Uloborus diversus TaxID=327109 RepID=UPI00240988AB|nr:probable 39S ribosomal protein L23, mitochondrial [Uloborus diversus]
MSFRLYPKYVKGNPQLRIFLPNFWMKLVKPPKNVPANQVHFIVPFEMTAVDVKNYLEKIYAVPVAQVRTQLYTGDIKKNFKNYLIKEEDYKMAFVTLPEEVKFEFPDLFPAEKKDKLDKDYKRITDQVKDLMKQRRRNWDRRDIPSWFGL